MIEMISFALTKTIAQTSYRLITFNKKG